MKPLKKLQLKGESKVIVIPPIDDEEIQDRSDNYFKLSKEDFAKRYRRHAFTPVTINMKGQNFVIDVNKCADPFCKNFGKPQERYNHLKSKPSRYKLHGEIDNKRLFCNDVDDGSVGMPISKTLILLSNWSCAEEIKRLVDINTISDIEPEYKFHNEGCLVASSPLDDPKAFYKRGKSTSNSQKYQCKVCNKITNVLPNQSGSFTYNQQRNDILPMFMKQILNHTPVSRTLEILDIGASTYYNKLEWIYLKCLEFLERHETKPLASMRFDELWLETDKFHYYLNNIRKKGSGSKDRVIEKPQFPTFIIATTDRSSSYVFRTDLSFDYNITAGELIDDVNLYYEDKLFSYTQKNARYRYSYYGNQGKDIDLIDFKDLELRKHYIDGFHVNTTYTAYAQYYLINQMLNVSRLNYIVDADNSLITSLMRVHSSDIKEGKTHIFTCSVDKNLSKEDAYNEYLSKKQKINDWRENYNSKATIREATTNLLADGLELRPLYTHQVYKGVKHPVKTTYSIEHPYPFKDEGVRYVNCLTDLSHLSNVALAEALYKVNMRAINTYFNNIRRRSMILERPLVSVRGEGKSYIYANFNPRYAQYILTIVRTYLNFCIETKRGEDKDTPAMRLGIATKPYTIQDILYMK